MSWDLPGFQTRRVSRDAAPALAQPPPLKTCMAHSWDSYVPVQAKEVARTTVRKRPFSLVAVCGGAARHADVPRRKPRRRGATEVNLEDTNFRCQFCKSCPSFFDPK